MVGAVPGSWQKISLHSALAVTIRQQVTVNTISSHGEEKSGNGIFIAKNFSPISRIVAGFVRVERPNGSAIPPETFDTDP